MGYYYGNGCNTQGGFPCQDCPPKELGRVRSVFFVPASYTFTNISNPVEWMTNIINPGIGFILPYTNGSYSESAKESNSFGNIDKEVDSYEMAITGMEPGIGFTGAWWNSMSLNKTYQAGFRTQSLIYISNVAVQVIPTKKVDDDVQSRVLQGFSIKWVAGLPPVGAPMPQGIFDNCSESDFN